jgi:hypothetical protein
VGVFGVPVTSPPDSVNGFQVSGFPRVRGAALAFPPEVADDVARRMPELVTTAPVAGAEAAWLADVRRARDARRDLVLELRRAHPTELLWAVFDSPALVQRYGLGSDDPELADAVSAEYEWCDALVGTLLAAMTPEETLIVVSNRGFQSATRGISAAWCARLPEGVRVGARASRFEEGGWFVDPNATPDDVEAYRAALETLEDDGRRCFRAVHDLSKQELRGHAASIGPRIVAEPAEEFAIVSGAADSSRLVPIASAGRVGVPRLQGYFAMLGRFVEPGVVRDLDLADVSAIVMHRLGEKIPRRYVHNVPRRMFPLDYFVARPMSFSGRPEDELRRPSSLAPPSGDDGIEAQVRGLGYVR